MGKRSRNSRFDYDDFDIEDRHSHAKNRNRKVRRRKQRDTFSTKIFAFVLVLIVLLILAAGLFVGTRYLKDYLVKPLNKSIMAYEDLLDEYDAAEGEYLVVLHEAKDVAKGYNFIKYYKVQREMDEKAAEIKTYRSGQKVISDLKSEYLEHFKNYRITETYKQQYDEVMSKIDQAISDNDQTQLSMLKKELNSLEQNLKIDNENLVQSGKNEINHLGLHSANPQDNAVMKEYEGQVDDYLAEGNYARALDVLDQWKILAGVTAERIEESESRAKEIMESNRLNHENDEEFFQSGYVFQDSNARNLEMDELVKLSRWGRKIAMYEIYARHGCMFTDNTIQSYFNQQYWYIPQHEPGDFDESVFNEYEAANVSLLRSLN